MAKARAIARGEPIEDSDAEDQEGDAEDGGDEEEGAGKGKKDPNVGSESIASLSAKVVGTHLKPRPRPIVDLEEEDEEEEVPVLINRDLPNLKTVLEKADVLFEVLDGRDPLAFRSQHIEDLGSELGKKVLLVVNKIGEFDAEIHEMESASLTRLFTDTCPREAVASWSSYLRSQHPTFLFRSATSFLPENSVAQSQPQVKKGKAKAKVPTNDCVGGDSILACLAQWAKEKNGDEPLVVAVVGVTNVGIVSPFISHRRMLISLFFAGGQKFTDKLVTQTGCTARIYPRLIISWAYDNGASAGSNFRIRRPNNSFH